LDYTFNIAVVFFLVHNIRFTSCLINLTNTHNSHVYGSSLGGHIIMTSSEDKVAKAPEQTMMV